jgi:hypothetical protein
MPLATSTHHTWWNSVSAVDATRFPVNATTSATPIVAPRLRTACVTAEPEPEP